jgi:hypothetical protein
MSEIKQESIKRMIRAMNSILNLYDENDIPDAITNILMTGIVEVASKLGLTDIAISNKDGDIIKFVMPEDFTAWKQLLESVVKTL